jgi:hypothetical protein
MIFIEINWKFTASYTLNQNGIAERSNKTIITRIHTIMLIVPEFPKSLSIEAASITIYLTNRSLIKIFPNSMTLYELFYGKRSSYLYLRIFKYAAYILNLHIKKADKLTVKLEKL